MSKRKQLKRALAGAGAVILVLATSYLVIRTWHLRWGAGDEDLARAMPGDLSGARWTRAVTVNAPPERIWPWLVQWGQGRGGWYSYDWLENLFGFDIHTAERIVPEYQQLAVGDPICMARGFCPSKVTVVEANRWLSWQARDDKDQVMWTFTFGLFPIDDQHTRLVVRESFDPVLMPAPAAFVLEIPDVVMELKAIDTLKNRAEGRVEPGYVSVLEILAWLAALAIGVVAGLWVVTRPDWRAPFGVGVAALLVLQVITFLFPPLWLRGLLDLGLLVALLAAARFRRTAPAAQAAQSQAKAASH